VLAGGYDPVTPPAWGESTATAQGSAFYYEFPQASRGVMRSPASGLSIGLQSLEDPRTEPDTSCIADHPDADLTIGALAEQVSMSERSFQRLCTREVGMSPGEYVERTRIDAARRLLE
jgi:transcriptional regulator GlxA family with amidase domain